MRDMASETNKRAGMDMLNGSIWNKLIIFALPILASSVLQQLFNAADVAVAGRFAGSTALAAVGSTGALINLIINLFVGCATGCNVLIARQVARKDELSVKEAVSTSLIFAVVSGLFLIVVGYFLARPLLLLMGSPEDVIEHSTIYIKIYFVGMPFLMVYNFGAAILRSVGDTKRPLIALALSGIINVILNIVFVAVFKMGVSGVALATIISEGISASLVIRFLTHYDGMIKLDFKNLKFNVKHLKSLVSIGLPAGLQGCVFSLSNVCIQSGINSFGSVAMAGNATAMNYESLSYFISSAYVQSAITFASQNYAVGNYKRTKSVHHDALFICMISMFIFDMLVFTFRAPLLTVFTSEEDVMAYGFMKFEMCLVPHAMIAIYEVTAGILRAMGKSLLPALICIIGTCAVRLGWVYFIFPLHRTFKFLLAVYPVSWLITATLMVTAYQIMKKKLLIIDKKPN